MSVGAGAFAVAGGAEANRTPAPGVLLHRLSGPLNALLACGFARLASGGVIELFPDAREAAEGGMISISMTVPVYCPQCVGYADSAGRCSRCGGRRTIDELFSAWLALPPGVTDGTTLMPSAVLPGMVWPLSFRIRR